jgi:pyridoxamine 5'-phosphate oxidase
MSGEESDLYFASRPEGSQLGAWASQQSAVLPDRGPLETRYEELSTQYEGQRIPRPPFWGGYRVVPETVEFWQGRVNRLHDRLRYYRHADGSWVIERLSP